MPISINCPSCSTKLRAPESVIGHNVKCPKCGTSIAVPASNGTKPAPAGKPASKTASAAKPAVKAAPAGKPAAAAKPAVKAKPPAAEASAWEQSDLLRHDEWTIKLKGFFVLNIKNRHYNILVPGTKDVIGVADETASALILALRMFRLDKWLPTTVEVRDQPDGPLLLAIRKAVTPFAFTTTFEIFDDRHEKIGYFQTKIFSLFGGFWVYDAEGKELAEVKAKLGLPPRYVFHAKDGRELGSITSEAYAQIAEAVQEKKAKVVMSFGRPGLQLKVHESMADQPTIKVLMLATALAIEFGGLGGKLLDKK